MFLVGWRIHFNNNHLQVVKCLEFMNGSALVPFIGSVDVLKVTSAGAMFTNPAHDISIFFPKGSIPDGIYARVEVGVSLTGPFMFQKDEYPISAILFICFQENIQLLLPVEIVMPHTINIQSQNEIKSCSIKFSKAVHTVCRSNGNKFNFEPVTYESEFVAFNGQGFGVLKAQSLCFYCITNEKSKPNIPREHSYRVNIITSRERVSNDWFRDIVDVRITHDLASCCMVSFLQVMTYCCTVTDFQINIVISESVMIKIFHITSALFSYSTSARK